jgi:methionyl-tRNA formyltransferase
LRRVRAFNPWPIAETRLHGAQVRLWDAELSPVGATTEAPAAPGTVLAASAAGIDVACGQGALRILRLQLAGRKPQSAGDFIRARQLVGATLAAS